MEQFRTEAIAYLSGLESSGAGGYWDGGGVISTPSILVVLALLPGGVDVIPFGAGGSPSYWPA